MPPWVFVWVFFSREGEREGGRKRGQRQGGSFHFISNSYVIFFAKAKVCMSVSFQNARYEELCSSLASENRALMISFSEMS